MRRIVGIDPGLSGALALHDGWELIEVVDMPTAAGRVVGSDVAEVLERWKPELVVIEQVNAYRKSAASRAFAFGRAFGCVEGVVEAAGYPLEELSPARWKRVMGLSRDKNESRALATRLWPAHRQAFRLAKDDGRAEAALIAAAWWRLRAPQMESFAVVQ